MSPTDKRRSAIHPASPSSAHAAHGGSRASSVIAAPPRAQLGSGGASSSTATGAPENKIPDQSTANATMNHTPSKDSRVSSKSTKEKDGQLLREKDEKIATLKRDLAEMATEFERTLDRLSHSESETASYWQAKHSALAQQHTRAETELSLLQAELDIRMAEREEMREALDVMRVALGAREKEVQSLTGHLAKMKQWISASTRMDDQTSDQEFAELMMKLMNGLQNWVISHFKKARLDISSAGGDVVGELARLVPEFAQVACQSKLALLQSIVSQIMVELVFEPYFPGLPEDQNKKLQAHEHDLSQLMSVEAVNSWRSNTLILLKKHSVDIIQKHSACLINDGVVRLNKILGSITDAEATDSRDQAAHVLLGTAIELAQSLATQKARFDADMPAILSQQNITYDPSFMEDTSGEDDDDLVGRPVLCIIFPGLVKTGDAAGENLQFRNVICKAKVLCALE